MSDPFVEEFERRTGNQLPIRSKGILSEMVTAKVQELEERVKEADALRAINSMVKTGRSKK